MYNSGMKKPIMEQTLPLIIGVLGVVVSMALLTGQVMA